MRHLFRSSLITFALLALGACTEGDDIERRYVRDSLRMPESASWPQKGNPQAQTVAMHGHAERLTPQNRRFGGLDSMVAHREIRALVPYSKTFYYLDGPRRQGISYDMLVQFEDFINRKLGKGMPLLNIVFIPVPRDELISGLAEGFGDLAVGNLTITPERQKYVDFSDPFLDEVSEIVVAGPAGDSLQSLTDLAGKKVFVRPSSSYYESLQQLNDSLRSQGLQRVDIRKVDEYLEDSDVLELVNAGVIPYTIIDSHKGMVWEKVLDHITLYPQLALRSNGQVGWAFRKQSPKLESLVNDFVRNHRKGTLMGNILIKRYLNQTDWLEKKPSEGEMERFQELVGYFQNYADQYGFDWLLIAAQAYQESGFRQSAVSSAGAVGIMQIKPSTARDPNINVPDIQEAENNIHAGIKYLHFLLDHYLRDEPLDTLNRTLFALASYNAGPARIRRLRQAAKARGLDPNIWFDNVELVAASQVGREPVRYVSNIYKYYVSLRALARWMDEKERRFS